MKKVILLIVVVAGLGVGAFFILGQYFTQAQIRGRVKDLFDKSNGLRSGYDTTDGELAKFFDLENYDPNSTHPYTWTEKWRVENVDPEFWRTLDSLEIETFTRSEATVRFTVLEGFPGDKKKNIAPQHKPYRYTASLVYVAAEGDWFLRSLKGLDE